MAVSTRYQHTGLVLVRASTDPGDFDVPSDLSLSDPDAVTQEGWAWLAKLWARPEVPEALRFASPSLTTRVEQLLVAGAKPSNVRELRRAVSSVASYLLRWQRRATPFGMFAGVGVATVGPARADVSTGHRVVVRSDAEWLAALVDQLEAHHGLRPKLTVVADSARVVRDGRVVVHPRAELGSPDPGPLREASVQLSRPVAFALAAAVSPVRFDALTARVVARFPSASQDRVQALLHGLVDGGFLITSLRPPSTAGDPLAHLCHELRAAGGDGLPDVAATLRKLDDIRAQVACHNSTPDSGSEQARGFRAAITAQMTALASRPGHALAADVQLDARVSVPERVFAEAALAASVLLRVTTQPFGSAAWLDYHARFRARYGPGALVPVRELVADSGLGYPAGYLGAPRARLAWRLLTERDAAVTALIQQATLQGAEEISLSDADVDALTVGQHADVVPPPRVEIGVALHATSTAAVDRGEFQLRVTAAPRTPTSMAGRFAHLLDDAARSRLAGGYGAGPERSAPDGPLVVQLSFPPRRPHNENVTRVPALLGDVVALSEHPPACPGVRVVDVDDLAVTADADQMYLVQRSTGRRVIPRIPHALDTTAQTPPLARFVAEVADARSAVYGGFDLGAARTLPYVPRIRYRRTVLSAARWIVTSADLQPRAPGEGAEDALCSWRHRWRVPARVVLCHGELRLPLDLDRSLDRALLHTHLGRAERVELQEDAPPGGDSWIGRPAELLIPLTVTDPADRRLPASAAPGAVLRPGDSGVLHAHLTGNPARFDDILTDHLPRFADNLCDVDHLVVSWWVRRHRDLIRPEADQYLAVTLRLGGPEHYGPVAAKVAAFAADLGARGLPSQLTLASYPQHPARYGDGPALDAAERVFAADTGAAIAQLVTARASGLPAQSLAAVSMARLAASFAPDPESGCQTLLTCLRQEHGLVDRAVRDHALALADPDDADRALRQLPGGPVVTAAWAARDRALAAYHRELTQQRREPSTVLRTLLHEHHVRAVGVDSTYEKQTGRLARAVALRRLALAGAL